MARLGYIVSLILLLTFFQLPKAQDTTVYANTFSNSFPNTLTEAYNNGFISYLAWYRTITQHSGYIQFYDDCGGSNNCGNILSTMPINFAAFDTLNISLDLRTSQSGGTGQFYILIEDSLAFYLLPSLTINLTTSWTNYTFSFLNLWTVSEEFSSGFVGPTRIAFLYYHSNTNRWGRMRNLVINGKQVNVWIGNESDDWFTSANWSVGVPRPDWNTIIPYRPDGIGRPYYPFVTGNAEVADLDIEENAIVAVTSQGTLTAHGTVNMGGEYNVSVLGDETGMGSFIDHGIEGPGKGYVEQFVSGDRWHYMSPPLSNPVAISYYGIYLLPYEESISNWGSYVSDPYLPLTVMRGYGVWSSSVWPPRGDTIISYAGFLNSGENAINVTYTGYTGDPNKDGWNLVGNPYPSGLHWDSAGWTKNNISNTVYFWMPGTQTYGTYQGGTGIGLNGATGEIPVGQGFFVKALGNGSIGVDNRTRIHTSKMLYKTTAEKNLDNSLRLMVNGFGFQDETVIRFHPGASHGFESQLDAFKLFASNLQVPQLYTRIPDNNLHLAINCLPAIHENMSVPLSFRFGTPGTYTLSVNQLESFPSNLIVVLEDLVTDSLHDLRVNPSYVFLAQTGNPLDRFVLHFYPVIIEGLITYNHDSTLSIPGAQVYIRDYHGAIKSSGVSDDYGYFGLGNVDEGWWLAGAEIQDLPWGGVNSTDALHISRYFVGMQNLTALQIKAGDVDASGYLNNADALTIMKRFVGMIDAFPSGDWCVPEVSFLIHDDDKYTLHLGALCYGDVDASNQLFTKAYDGPVISQDNDYHVEASGKKHSLPILASAAGQIGAISLHTMVHPGLRVNSIQTPHQGTLLFRQHGEDLYITWMDPAGMKVNKGDVIFILESEIEQLPEDGRWIEIAGPSEIADDGAQAMKGYILHVPNLRYPERETALLDIYPNPARGFVNITLSPINTDQSFVLELMDITGRQILAWSATSKAGLPFNQVIDLSDVMPGTYTLKASYNHPGIPATTSILIITH